MGQGAAGRALRPASVRPRTEVEVAAVDGGQVALIPVDDVVLLLLGGGPHRRGRHKVAARTAQRAGARLHSQTAASVTAHNGQSCQAASVLHTRTLFAATQHNDIMLHSSMVLPVRHSRSRWWRRSRRCRATSGCSAGRTRAHTPAARTCARSAAAGPPPAPGRCRTAGGATPLRTRFVANVLP